MDWSSGGSREGAREGGTPLFLDQTEKKKFLETAPHPLFLRIWMTASPSPSTPNTYLKVWIQHYEVITLQRYKIYKLILHFLSCCLAYKLK